MDEEQGSGGADGFLSRTRATDSPPRPRCPARAFGGLDGFTALASPAASTAASIQGGGSAPNGMRLGLTTAPTGYKAPQFEFGTVAAMGATAADPPTFTCTPTWKEHMDEGTNVCWYLPAGKHKSITPSGGKDVYITMSAAMSALDSGRARARGQHQAGPRHLHQGGRNLLTLPRRRQDLPVRRDRDGRPKHVLDAITANLVHPGLGNDQTTWAATYDRLFMKTGLRDAEAGTPSA